MVYTSKFYPQGNAINESSHRGLIDTVLASLAMGSNMVSAVEDAVAGYNTN